MHCIRRYKDIILNIILAGGNTDTNGAGAILGTLMDNKDCLTNGLIECHM